MTVVPAQRPVRTTAPAGPASLTQRGSRTASSCPSCSSGRVTTLAMTLTDGTPVQFSSCHECEHRTWTHEGQQMPFADVITRATKHKA